MKLNIRLLIHIISIFLITVGACTLLVGFLLDFDIDFTVGMILLIVGLVVLPLNKII